MKKVLLSAVFGSAIFLAACGGGDKEAKPAEDKSGEATEVAAGESIAKKSCVSCHGGELQGQGNTPALNNIGSTLSEEEILDVIENGTDKGMPGGLISGDDAKEVAAWLATQK